jgi:hypothetical protein
MMQLFFVVVVCALFVATMGYVSRPTQIVKAATASRTSLFAHHVNAKVTKKMMKNRPKKHRLSDINRKNVNMHKCITKVENAPAEYTLMSAEGKLPLDGHIYVRADDRTGTTFATPSYPHI